MPLVLLQDQSAVITSQVSKHCVHGGHARHDQVARLLWLCKVDRQLLYSLTYTH